MAFLAELPRIPSPGDIADTLNNLRSEIGDELNDGSRIAARETIPDDIEVILGEEDARRGRKDIERPRIIFLASRNETYQLEERRRPRE